MTKADKQKIFDKVAKHLLTQGKKAADESGACFYRKDGLKCAAGVLIPDTKYDENLENSIVSYYKVEAVLPKYAQREIDFVEELQCIHDSSFYGPERWLDKLSTLAKNEGLSTSVLDDFRGART